MTPWELAACVEGWNAVHGADQGTPEPMTEERERALIESVQHLLD